MREKLYGKKSPLIMETTGRENEVHNATEKPEIYGSMRVV